MCPHFLSKRFSSKHMSRNSHSHTLKLFILNVKHIKQTFINRLDDRGIHRDKLFAFTLSNCFTYKSVVKTKRAENYINQLKLNEQKTKLIII